MKRQRNRQALGRLKNLKRSMRSFSRMSEVKRGKRLNKSSLNYDRQLDSLLLTMKTLRSSFSLSIAVCIRAGMVKMAEVYLRKRVRSNDHQHV